MPSYSMIHFQFIHPFFSIFGIIGNIWILFTLGLGKVPISTTTKFYYLLIGVGDLSLIICHFFWAGLCDTLWIWSKGKFFLCLDIFSPFSCVIMRLWYYLSEFLSNYTLVAFSIERLIAVCWPFRAKTMLTKTFTIYLLLFLNVPGFLFYLIVIPFGSAIIPITRVVSFTCHSNYYNIFGLLFNISMSIIILGLHTLVDLVVSIILFLKLYIFRKNVDSSLNFKQGSKEISATLTLLMLCLITFIIYGTCLMAYLVTLTYSYFKIFSDELVSIGYVIFALFISSTNIPHSLNILIYLTLIPSFRHSAFCKLYKMIYFHSSTLTATTHRNGPDPHN